MAWFRRDASVDIIFDSAKFQEVVGQVKALIDDLLAARAEVEKATAALEQARKDLDVATRKLQAVKKRPTIVNR